VDYLNGTTGSQKSLQDVLDDSERLSILQKLINMRQGKGTRHDDQIPLRAMSPVYLNEYLSRAEYYAEWLKERLGDANLPESAEQRMGLLIEKRIEAYQELCDIVYKKKGYTSDGILKRETVVKFGLLDEQANRLLNSFGV
jgi:aldehyde:ferredoxin oxidoreductase